MSCRRPGVVLTNRTGVRLPDPAFLTSPVELALIRHARGRVCVSVVVVDDAEMKRLNRVYHNSRGSTDVLSFPDGDPDPEQGGVNLGEVVICRDRALVEAGRRGLRLRDELALYALHGALHLVGFRDHTPEARVRMEREQDRILAGCARG